MTRTGQAAVDWALAQADHASTDWYRQCKKFVRLAFAVPSDGTVDAGKAWDKAAHKHFESNPHLIPAGVPVFWEMESVADHVAISIGNGQCVSTDWPASHDVGVVDIGLLSSQWRGTLLGWTEDIDSVRVYTAPPEPPAPNRVQKARRHARQAVDLLDKAIEAGRGDDIREMRASIRRALRDGPKS